MTGNAIKKTLEYHKISPKTIKHYGDIVVGLFFKPDNNLNALIKTTEAGTVHPANAGMFKKARSNFKNLHVPYLLTRDSSRMDIMR